MKISRFIPFLCLCTSLCADYWEIPKEKLNMGYEESWNRNYAEALETAKRENRPLVIAFVGLNWCRWSKQFYEKVLTEKEFIKELEKTCVLTWVDYPEQQVSANEFLKKKYDLHQIPTLVIATPDEQLISQISYTEIAPKEFAHRILDTISSYKTLTHDLQSVDLQTCSQTTLKRWYEQAEKIGCNAIKNSLLKAGLVEHSLYFLLQKYTQVINGNRKERKEAESLRKKIIALDPKNEEGSMRTIALAEFETLAHHVKKDPHITIQPLLAYLETYGKEDNDNWKVEMKVAQYLFSKDCIADAIDHAERALDTVPAAYRNEVLDSLTYMKSQ